VNALVLNKVDKVVDPLALHLLVEGRHEEVIHVSAVTGDGIDRLTAFVTNALDRRSQSVTVHVRPGDGRSIAAVRSAGAVDEEQVDDDGTMHIRLRLSPGALGLLRRQLGPGAIFEPSPAQPGDPQAAAPARSQAVTPTSATALPRSRAAGDGAVDPGST
jgi:hypothetical protein